MSITPSVPLCCGTIIHKTLAHEKIDCDLDHELFAVKTFNQMHVELWADW